MKGVFLDVNSIDNGDINLATLRSSVSHWQYYDTTADSEVGSRISDADIVICNKVKLQKQHFVNAKNLKLVCIAATGTNNVDLDAARATGITVCNITNYATPSVVEHVFCLILALTRKLNPYQSAVSSGQWQLSSNFCLLDYPINELNAKTLGIVGYGVLGKAVARVGEAFGMKILVAARKGAQAQVDRIPFKELLQQADVISLHCPLNSETANLIDENEFKCMKPGAMLINTARGGIVNEQALVKALQSQLIAGAAVDVLSEEPPNDGNALLDVSLPNLIVTPHIAWASVQSRQRAIDQVAENIVAFQDGAPRNVVS